MRNAVGTYFSKNEQKQESWGEITLWLAYKVDTEKETYKLKEKH